MKHLLFLLILTSSIVIHAQEAMNDYKYILVNNQYDFQNSANQYRLNEQFVFELKKHHFNAYRTNEVLPTDINKGTCNSLRLDVVVQKGLQVKMQVYFRDCDDNIIYGPLKASSRFKDYKRDYRNCLKQIMSHLENYNHEYKKSNNVVIDKSAIEIPQTIPVSKVIENSKITYQTKDKIYSLKVQEKDYVVLKNNEVIGTLKKSKGGCYLAMTTDFIGIGYIIENELHIEYDSTKSNSIIFKKRQ